MMVAPKVEVGYLEQTAVAGSTQTVWQEVRSRMTQLLTAEAAMKEAEKAIAAGGWVAGWLAAWVIRPQNVLKERGWTMVGRKARQLQFVAAAVAPVARVPF